MTLIVLTVLLLQNPFEWKASQQKTAGRVSDVLVVTDIAADTIDSLRHERKTHALGCQALRMGITVGANEAVKRLVHKQRPDGSDNKSFYSMHSSASMVSSGWRVSIGASISIGAGYFRMAANKHDLIDVSAGLLVGFAGQKVCEK